MSALLYAMAVLASRGTNAKVNLLLRSWIGP
jgi:hypothetical protein